jgi:hypothetical protein
MKKQLSEFKRMQQLAGIIIEAVEIPTWLKGKLEDVHIKPGQGSIFSKSIDIVLELAQDALDKESNIDKIANSTGTLTIKSPGIGYNLVLPIEQAKKLPGAKEVEVEKTEGPNKIKVPAITTTAPLTQFKSDELTVIVRPKKDESGIVIPNEYIVLSAFPGDPSIPRASEWGGKYAVIIPEEKGIEEIINEVLSKHRKKYKNSLDEDSLSEDVSDNEIEKAVATALKISPDQVIDHKPSEEEKKINEIGFDPVAIVAGGFTILGLIPIILDLLGGVINNLHKWFDINPVGLNPEEQIELKKLNKAIEEKEKYIKRLDSKNDPKKNKERKRLKDLLRIKAEKFPSKTGSELKHIAHKVHDKYIRIIMKFLQFTAWTTEKFGKKTKLSDPKYQEKVANLIYCGIMLWAAGVGIVSHISHLNGVDAVVKFVVESYKAGKSLSDIIKDALALI